jgi:carbonic anhydrase
MIVKQLRSSTPILSELVAHGKLRIVGAVYSIETGSVTWLKDEDESTQGEARAAGPDHLLFSHGLH